MNRSYEESYEGYLGYIESKFSGVSENIASIRKVAKATRGFDLPEFVEPKTWLIRNSSDVAVEIDQKSSDVTVEIDADLLAAWICHMSYSSRLRMELLEDAVIRSIAQSELLVASTLARGHMEAAAWAAYTNEELVKSSNSGSWEKLKKLIPKMLYGSAVAGEKNNLPSDAVLMTLIEPSSIMKAIDALDRFLSTVVDKKGRSSRVLYAILCDYAHPTIGGIRHLFDSTSESSESWTIQYSRNEKLDSIDVQAILGALLRNMRLGHAAALLMRLGVIDETRNGLRYEKPNWEDASVIWEHIMLGSLPQTGI